MRFIGDGSTRTAEQASHAIDHFEHEWEESGFGLFAVELEETGALMGFTGLSHPVFLPEILPAVEIGWRFARFYWGNGFASEAATKALSFSVTTLGITDIVSICQTENGASKRIMQKLGMRFDRRAIDQTCNREVEVYRLLKR